MKKYLGLLVIFSFMAILLLPASPCFAASAKVDINANNEQVTVGDTVYVYIKINSGTSFGDFEADLTYDNSILEYQSGASVITGGSGYLKISDMENGQLDTSRKYALEFKAMKVGTCEIAFSGQVMVYDDSGLEMPVSSDSVNITVKAAQTASTDANLKSLETSPTDITPSFDKNIFDYKVTVNHDTDKLIINAIPEDEKANVSISGNDFLQDGENKIVITVLAESGDIIKYTIKVMRQAAPTITNAPVLTQPADQSDLKITEEEDGTYIEYNLRLKLIGADSEAKIPAGYIGTELTLNEITIYAYVPENDPESNIVLVYAEDTSGNTDLYQYDKDNNTLKPYIPVSANSNNDKADISKAATIIAALSTLCVLLLIALGWLLLKRKSSIKDDAE